MRKLTEIEDAFYKWRNALRPIKWQALEAGTMFTLQHATLNNNCLFKVTRKTPTRRYVKSTGAQHVSKDKIIGPDYSVPMYFVAPDDYGRYLALLTEAKAVAEWNNVKGAAWKDTYMLYDYDNDGHIIVAGYNGNGSVIVKQEITFSDDSDISEETALAMAKVLCVGFRSCGNNFYMRHVPGLA